MRTLLSLPFLLLALPLSAQCCLGAQDSKAESPGGRYRVEATSLKGTGPDAHGPYRFRFRTLRVLDDGATKELGSFERAWDCRSHFSMQIHVSPTGNGFLLGSSLEPALRFYAPDGTVLRELSCEKKHWIGWGTPPPAAFQVQLRSWVKGVEARETWLWLPLCHIVGPEMHSARKANGKPAAIKGDPRWTGLHEDEVVWLVRMLNWTPSQGERQSEKVEHLVQRLRDKKHQKQAAAELLSLGLSAVAALREAGDRDKELAAFTRPILLEVRARLGGHKDPWQNRELLEALTQHPNSDLVAVAQGRLNALAKKAKR